MSGTRLTLAFAGVAALALGVLGPAAARIGAAPKYGGELVVGLSQGDPATLDPTLTASTALSVNQILYTMCEPLYDRDSKLRSRPVLAAALPEISRNKLTYTVQLRKGIEFNDGTPFNAQAVVTT